MSALTQQRAALQASLREHPCAPNWYLGTEQELRAAGLIEPYMVLSRVPSSAWRSDNTR